MNMDWNELSREIARETGCDPDFGFSQDGQHPWVVAAIRIATLREREACAKECERMVMYPGGRQEAPAHNTVWDAARAIRMRSNAQVVGLAEGQSHTNSVLGG